MADNDDTLETGPDLSTFVPETFKGEDGNFDTAAFRSQYDELATFKATQEERTSSLPKDPSEYAFALGEDHQWPEGFNPEGMKTTDEEGNEIAFDPSAFFDKDDPDIPLVQSLLHEVGAPAEAMGKIASIMANREIRAVMQSAAKAESEKKALGPDAQSRIDTVTRTLQANMDKAQAKAVLDGITSADALRGIEGLLQKSKVNPSPAPGHKVDHTEMSPIDRVIHGNSLRGKRA